MSAEERILLVYAAAHIMAVVVLDILIEMLAIEGDSFPICSIISNILRLAQPDSGCMLLLLLLHTPIIMASIFHHLSRIR